MTNPNYIRVKVKPKAQKNEITGLLDDGTIKISVKAPPERGKANEVVIELLQEKYKTKNVKIISGHTSQIKLIRID